MKKTMNEKTKRRIIKVIFCIVSVVTCFILFVNTCFAYQTGTNYDSTAFTFGEATYPVINVQNFYYTVDSSANRYWKTFPVASSYQLFGQGNFNGLGNPLTYNYQQTVSTNSAYTSIAPLSYLSSNLQNRIQDQIVNHSDFGYLFGYPLGDMQWDMLSNIDVLQSTIYDNSGYVSYNPELYVDGKLAFQISLSPGWYNLETLDRVYLTCYGNPTFMGNLYFTFDFTCLDSGVASHYGYLTEELPPITGGVTSEVKYPDDIYRDTYYFTIAPLQMLTRSNILFDEGNIRPEIGKYIYLHSFTITNVPWHISEYPPELYTGWYGARLIQPSIRTYSSDENTRRDVVIKTGFSPHYGLNTNALESWGDGIGNYTPPDVDDTTISRFGSFVGSAINSFLDTQIFLGVTLGGILFTCLAIGFVFAILRYFAGG